MPRGTWKPGLLNPVVGGAPQKQSLRWPVSSRGRHTFPSKALNCSARLPTACRPLLQSPDDTLSPGEQSQDS